MRSFLHKYCRAFENHILGLIGEYCGSVVDNNLFFSITTNLEFSVTKRRLLGKIYLRTRRVSNISDDFHDEKRILRKHFWIAERNLWVYFHISKRLRLLENRGGIFVNIKLLREWIDKHSTTDFILTDEKTRPDLIRFY
jgi:hypothetical protein